MTIAYAPRYLEKLAEQKTAWSKLWVEEEYLLLATPSERLEKRTDGRPDIHHVDNGYRATGRFLVRDGDTEVTVLMPTKEQLKALQGYFGQFATAFVQNGVKPEAVLSVITFYREALSKLVKAIANVWVAIEAAHAPHWQTECGLSDHIGNFECEYIGGMVNAFAENVELDINWYDED